MVKESLIQQTIISNLSALAGKYNFVYFAVLNEAWGAGRAKKKLSGGEYHRINEFKKMGMIPGVSDIVLVHKGSAYFIEVKNEKGKQSDKQILFMNKVLETGCDYAVVRSWGECKYCLEIWGIV